MAARLQVTLFWSGPHCFCSVHQVVLMVTNWHLNEKSREVSLLAFIDQVVSTLIRWFREELQYVVPLHLCCYLCGLPAWEHSPHVPCSHGGVSRKRKVVPSSGFQIPEAFTTWIHPFNWRCFLSQIRNLLCISLVGFSVVRLVFRGEKAVLAPKPPPSPHPPQWQLVR